MNLYKKRSLISTKNLPLRNSLIIPKPIITHCYCFAKIYFQQFLIVKSKRQQPYFETISNIINQNLLIICQMHQMLLGIIDIMIKSMNLLLQHNIIPKFLQFRNRLSLLKYNNNIFLQLNQDVVKKSVNLIFKKVNNLLHLVQL